MADKKSVVMVGGDIAQSKAFRLLEQALKANGITVNSFLGDGRPVADHPDKIIDSIKASDVVLTGLSSRQPQSEAELLALQTAIENGIPCGVYQDTYGIWRRAQFQSLMDKVNFIFAIDAIEAEAINQAYPDIEIVVVGNPTWDEYFFPELSREAVRTTLNLTSNELMVLISGVKRVEVDLPMFQAFVDVKLDELTGRRVRLIYSPHPGEENVSFEVGKEFPELCSDQGRLRVEAVYKEVMNGGMMLPGADLVVSSVSSLIIGAACRCIPVIGYLNQSEKDRQIEVNGQPIWRPLEMGFCPLCQVTDTRHDNLVEILKPLIRANGSIAYTEDCLQIAEECFPQPQEPGQPAKQMADYLQTVMER